MAIISAKTSIYLTIFTLLAAVFFALGTPVEAADPDFLVSWKSSNYAPAGFLGKIFPVNQTGINVSFELIGNSSFDAGKIIDLSNSEVRWSVNGKMLSKAVGAKNFSFVTSDADDSQTDLKISAEYFDQSANYSYFVNKYVAIPLVSPDVVVGYKNIGTSLAKGAANILNAAPYFFNSPAQKLLVTWNINDQEVAPDPADRWTLGVNLSGDYPSGSDVKVIVSAKDIFNQGVTASKIYHFLSR